jgi:spermidine/putrescine-binding protein
MIHHPPPAAIIRRTILALAGLALAWGCARRDEASAPPSAGGSPDGAPPRVCVLTWPDYFSDRACEDFTRETGVRIEWRHFENLGEMNALLRSQRDAFDVVVLDDMSLAEHIELKLLRPIDRASIPNFRHIDPRYRDASFDPGNAFSVPYMWGTTLVAYRKDQIADPGKSWRLLWDPALAGKVLMLNEKQDVYAAALHTLGLPPSSDDAGDLERATGLLLEQVDRAGANYADLETIKTKLQAGECWAAMMYSGDAALIASEDPQIGTFIPVEGAPLWLDSFAIPKEAPRTANAHRFIDFMTRPEIAAENANFLAYATANRAAIPMLDPDLRGDETVFPPPEVLARCQFIPKANEKRDALTNQGMKRLFDRIQQRARSQQPAS